MSKHDGFKGYAPSNGTGPNGSGTGSALLGFLIIAAVVAVILHAAMHHGTGR